MTTCHKIKRGIFFDYSVMECNISEEIKS